MATQTIPLSSPSGNRSTFHLMHILLQVLDQHMRYQRDNRIGQDGGPIGVMEKVRGIK